jgi:hypothetical protein
MTSIRLAAAQSLLSLLSGMTNPTTNAPLFGVTKLGAIFDAGQSATTWAEIIHHQGLSVHEGSGGNTIGWRIRDTCTFRITCGAGPYQLDSDAAQISMLTIMDVVLPALHEHYQLPTSGNPTVPLPFVYSVLTDQPDRSMPVRWPDGNIWLQWDLSVQVASAYSITLTSP